MMKHLKKELPELKKCPNNVYVLYIIPIKNTIGFLRKDEIKSFDFIYENDVGELIGWSHWEGNTITLKSHNSKINFKMFNKYIKITDFNGINIIGIDTKRLTIETYKLKDINTSELTPEDLIKIYGYDYKYSCELLEEPFVKYLLQKTDKLEKAVALANDYLKSKEKVSEWWDIDFMQMEKFLKGE